MTHYKVIQTGKLFEVYKAQYPFRTGARAIATDFNAPVPNRESEYKARSATRARNKIRRLVQTNFDRSSKFITLTFRDNSELDITNLRDCYSEFRLFIMRLRYKFPDIKYVAVPEIQRKNHRGAVHYHIVMDIPYIPSHQLANLWKLGFVKINRIDYSKKVGVYVSKYITKDILQARENGLKTYYRSQNLREPKVIYGHDAEIIHQTLFDRHVDKIEYQMTYDSEYNGKIQYTEFNFYFEKGGEKIEIIHRLNDKRPLHKNLYH